MPGQVDLAVASDDPPVALDQDRRIVVARLALLLGQLGIAEIETDLEVECPGDHGGQRPASRGHPNREGP